MENLGNEQSEEEIAKRRDEAIRRALSTPRKLKSKSDKKAARMKKKRDDKTN